MERIGIYGGTFNPPHLGHIHAAQCAVSALGLDKLLMIPDRIAPHKQLPADSPSPEQRLDMLRLAAKDVDKAEVSDIELKRQGISYTYETIAQVRQMYPDAELYLLMGTDMFLTLQNWKNPELIWKDAVIAGFCRGERGEKEALAKQKQFLESQGAKAVLVENPVLTISSTDLRRMLVFRCADSFLPQGVGDYIRDNGLYGVARNLKGLPMEQLEQVVVSLLKKSRVNHVLGCRDTAVELARRWGANVTDAARAGILHDITKAIDGPLQLTLCAEYGTILDDFSVRYPKTLHQLTGSLVAERIFGENEAVVSAVRHHTTGKADMNLLEKIIYVSDYMEPCRDFPGVERLRELAYSDIDEALKLGLVMTLEHLKNQGSEVSPESREALTFLNR